MSEQMDPAMEQKRGLTRMQVKRLVQAINPDFVEKKRNQSYMAQHEVRAELTRIFGYGNWDSQVEEMQFVYEYEVGPDHPEYPRDKPKDKTYWRVCYRAAVRLTIRDYWGHEVCSFVEWHAEANSVLPDRGEAHAMAITSVESYALRRAAINLGDRLGLGLYKKGQTDPLVRGTLQLIDPASPQYAQGEEKEAAPGLARLQEATNTADERGEN